MTILSIFSNRPDFIRPQYASLKKHLKDDFYYVVVNNLCTINEYPEVIQEICEREGTGYACLNHSDKDLDVSKLVRNTLNFLWKDFKKTKGILAIIDSDVFLTEDISFSELLNGYDMAFCPIYTAGKVWPWTGFMLFNMDTIKADDVSFSFYALDGKLYSDVGSGLYAYIKKHNPKIRLLNRKDILDTDWPVKGKETLYTLGFPKPYSVDIISTGDYPFLFHYKTSSNYAPHCTMEYNIKKTEALWKIL